MALNQPKQGLYIPNPTGPVKLQSRSATRSRLNTAGTFFRSFERGQQANFIKIGVFEDLYGTPSPLDDEGVCVVQHTQLKPDEQLSAAGMGTPALQMQKLSIDWNQELQIAYSGTEWRAELVGIRWQIAPGPVPAPIDLGPVKDGLFSNGEVAFKINGIDGWPLGAIVYLRPRVRRYTLVPHDVIDPDTMQSTTGWNPAALRATLNADATGFVTMPERGAPSTPPDPPNPGDDAQDTGSDATFVTPAAMMNMQGGDGLPASPVGINTGPDRVLVHLNYSELDNGSMGSLNQIFEWTGDTATIGSWQRYL